MAFAPRDKPNYVLMDDCDCGAMYKSKTMKSPFIQTLNAWARAVDSGRVIEYDAQTVHGLHVVTPWHNITNRPRGWCVGSFMTPFTRAQATLQR